MHTHTHTYSLLHLVIRVLKVNAETMRQSLFVINDIEVNLSGHMLTERDKSARKLTKPPVSEGFPALIEGGYFPSHT